MLKDIEKFLKSAHPAREKNDEKRERFRFFSFRDIALRVVESLQNTIAIFHRLHNSP